VDSRKYSESGNRYFERSLNFLLIKKTSQKSPLGAVAGSGKTTNQSSKKTGKVEEMLQVEDTR